MAISLNPFFSNRSMILPVSPLCTASGFNIMKLLSPFAGLWYKFDAASFDDEVDEGCVGGGDLFSFLASLFSGFFDSLLSFLSNRWYYYAKLHIFTTFILYKTTCLHRFSKYANLNQIKN